MVEETQALAKFYLGWTEDGVSEDGLPRFKEQLCVKLAVPPYTALDRAATDDDIETYPGAYRLFEKEQVSIKRKTGEGFPLVLWPAVNSAELQMLAARDIFTVEQLAKLAAKGAGKDKMPGELRELAERAQQMVELTKEIGRFEVIIRDKDGQIAALTEQVGELRASIKAQDAMINRLKVA
jgi:hypothetical protein